MHTAIGRAACHQMHQAAGRLAGTVEVAAHVGEPSGILDIGI